ncbi:uncharacterized protein V1510DRAFT_419976 [Dipodascopsis tothii]|uniref:uncharacterized protein n=1 Tax=Dipodascopsis tothii TaxID=44089 RepID=UPI0034CE21C6
MLRERKVRQPRESHGAGRRRARGRGRGRPARGHEPRGRSRVASRLAPQPRAGLVSEGLAWPGHGQGDVAYLSAQTGAGTYWTPSWMTATIAATTARQLLARRRPDGQRAFGRSRSQPAGGGALDWAVGGGRRVLGRRSVGGKFGRPARGQALRTVRARCWTSCATWCRRRTLDAVLWSLEMAAVGLSAAACGRWRSLPALVCFCFARSARSLANNVTRRPAATLPPA